MTLPQLSSLARHLCELRVYTSKLDLSLEDYTRISEDIRDFSTWTKVIYANNGEDTNSPLGFTVALFGVKIYVCCPSARLEENEKENN